MLTERRFGVEIECGNPSGYSYVDSELKKLGIKPLSVGCDGSGVEVRSPILKGEKGLEWLKECMAALKEMGCYVTNSDGMHVHHEGKPDFRKPLMEYRSIPQWGFKNGQYGVHNVRKKVPVVHPEPCARLVNGWVANEQYIDKLVSPFRRTSGSCMKTWKNAENRKKVADEGNVEIGRGDLNLAQLVYEHGTIEIRLHEGTLDGDEAEAWVRFGQAFVEHASQSDTPLPKAKTLTELLTTLELPEDSAKLLKAKARRNGEHSKTSGWVKNPPPRNRTAGY